jgi:hypothetical protein
VAKRVEVEPEDLHVSAATVDAHADAVRTRHFEADARVEASQRGVPAASVAALGEAVTKWQIDTTVMFGRMIDHAHGLRSGATAYTQTDDVSGEALNRSERRISDVDLGL